MKQLSVDKKGEKGKDGTKEKKAWEWYPHVFITLTIWFLITVIGFGLGFKFESLVLSFLGLISATGINIFLLLIQVFQEKERKVRK